MSLYEAILEEGFNKDITVIKKTHYIRGTRQEKNGTAFVGCVIEALRANPFRRVDCDCHFKTDAEPWPAKSHEPGFELYKARFQLPHLDGSAKFGRIIYLINRELSQIHLLHLYTHRQYEKRPEDETIVARISNRTQTAK